MDCSNPGPPGEGMPSDDIGHLVPGGCAPSSSNCFSAIVPVPPRFWRPPPLPPPPPYHGYGPRPYSFPPLHQFRCGPPLFNVLPPFPSSHLNPPSVHPQTDDDATWLKNWLQSRPLEKDSNRSTAKCVSICDAQQKLKQWIQTLEVLSDGHKDLKDDADSLSKEEWADKWAVIEKSKSQICDLASSSFSEKPLEALQQKVMKRVKKRLRLKRQLAERRKDSYLAQLRRQRLHQKADTWLADMQLAVDRTRKAEKLKREADTVLAEVTRRQSEGRRQVALLEALQKLHQARLQTLEARGSKLSSEDKNSIQHSRLMFSRLLNLWSKKLEDYAKEEKGLRLMLEESAAKQSDLEIQNVRRILGEWESFLFGSKKCTSDELHDIHTLVSIRYAWDQYIVPDGAAVPMASAIPVGWVLPTTPSSSEWQQLLS